MAENNLNEKNYKDINKNRDIEIKRKERYARE